MEAAIAVELVERVLNEHFGPLPAKVASCLVARGPSAIYEIRDATRLEFWQIRNSLLTLIQHNVVVYKSETLPNTEQPIIRYAFDMREALFRTRYSQYAYYVHEIHGTAARLLFMQVLKHGRTTLAGAVAAALEELGKHFTSVVDMRACAEQHGDAFAELQRQLAQGTTMTDDNAEDDDNDDSVVASVLSSSLLKSSISLKPPSLKTAFVNLVADNFLIRIDMPTVTVASSDRSGAPTTQPTSDVSICLEHTSEASSDPRSTSPAKRPGNRGGARSMRNTAAKSKARKSMMDPALTALNEVHLSSLENEPALLSDGDDASKAGKKKRRLQRDEDSKAAQLKALMEDLETSGVVFRVNSRYLNLLLLRDVAEDFMAIRWADSRIVRLITRALLSTSRIQSHGIFTKGMSFDDLRSLLASYPADDKLKKSALFKPPDRNILLQLLDALGRTDQIIRNVTRDGVAVFLFDWDRFREIMRQRLLFNAISARLGTKAGRVWNLLLSGNASASTPDGTGKLWEDQLVADQALLPPHVSRDLLYQLARAGYVRIHQSDAVTGAPSNLSSKHAMLFTANEAMGQKRLLQDIYAMMLNVLTRKQFEAQSIASLMYRVTGLTEIEDSHLRLREAGEDRLEYSFLELDKVLLILRDMA